MTQEPGQAANLGACPKQPGYWRKVERSNTHESNGLSHLWFTRCSWGANTIGTGFSAKHFFHKVTITIPHQNAFLVRQNHAACQARSVLFAYEPCSNIYNNSPRFLRKRVL